LAQASRALAAPVRSRTSCLLATRPPGSLFLTTMPAWQVLIAAPGAVLITSFALSASAAEPPRQLRAGTPMPNHPKVSANSTTEMTTTTLTSTTAKGPQTPCGNEDESCFIDTDCCSGRCSFTFRCAPARRLSGSAADGDLPAVTTSIGDLPEVSASSTTDDGSACGHDYGQRRVTAAPSHRRALFDGQTMLLCALLALPRTSLFQNGALGACPLCLFAKFVAYVKTVGSVDFRLWLAT